MGAKTGITWTSATWNPVVGCTKVSPGCAACYAQQLHDQRHRAFQAGKLQNLPQYAEPFENVQLFPERMLLPLTWRTPRRIFVNSLSDLFHEAVPTAFIAQVWAVMALAPRHTFQVLTKRPERMRAVISAPNFYERVLSAAESVRTARPGLTAVPIANPTTAPLRNVWLGTSVENRRWTTRVPSLVNTPAAVRFISAEPLLQGWSLRGMTNGYYEGDIPVWSLLHWVIVGGESGPNARAMELDWARALRDEARDAGAAFFFKQRSGPRAGMLDGVPDDLRLQEFPA